jgi:hypothetical protein
MNISHKLSELNYERYQNFTISRNMRAIIYNRYFSIYIKKSNRVNTFSIRRYIWFSTQ